MLSPYEAVVVIRWKRGGRFDELYYTLRASCTVYTNVLHIISSRTSSCSLRGSFSHKREALILKSAHSRGLRPLAPTPRKRCRRNVSWEAPKTVLRSARDSVSDSESAAGRLSESLKMIPDPPSCAPGRKHRPHAGFPAFHRCRAWPRPRMGTPDHRPPSTAS